MSEYTPAEKAREALNTIIQELGTMRQIAEANAREAKNLRQQLHGTRQREEKPDGFSPWKPLPKGEKDEHYIDGHPIEHWHQIAKSTLKTNNTLIDRLREKERINADLEQKLETAINDRDAWYKRSQHQHACASKAENERDTALRELDAMREKMNCTAPPAMLDSILSLLDALEEDVNAK